MLQMSTTFTRPDDEIVKETQSRLYSLDGGIEALNESELLHLILGTGTKHHPLEEVVNEILALKNEYSLKGLNPSYLMSKVSGLNKKKAELLIAALELGKRVYTQEPAVGHTIRSPEDAASILMYMKHHTQEHFVALFLNTKNVVIGKKTIFVGSLNSSIVHPRELFHEAIQRSAASIIVAHSHPSGDPAPSKEDIEVTKRLAEAGKIIGIELLDHVIIGFDRFVSLKEKGYL
jgi:DNA repair protein RadC